MWWLAGPPCPVYFCCCLPETGSFVHSDLLPSAQIFFLHVSLNFLHWWLLVLHASLGKLNITLFVASPRPRMVWSQPCTWRGQLYCRILLLTWGGISFFSQRCIRTKRMFFSCGPAGREDDETYGSHGHVAVSASDAHDVSFWTITR